MSDFKMMPNTIPPKNIFKTPLSKKASEKPEQKNDKSILYSSYIYLGVAIVSLAVYSILFLYPQAHAYLTFADELSDVNQEISRYEDALIPSLEGKLNVHEAAYEKELEKIDSGVDDVFPVGIDKLNLVRQLENFATATNAKYPPFEFNSMSLGQPVEKDGYTILPISTSIHTSTANFQRFIAFIDLSGRLDQDYRIRLMEISNISVNYRGTDPRTGEDLGVDFSVKLNAYSR